MGAESTTTESRSGRGSWSSEIGRDVVVVEFAALCAEEEEEGECCAFDVDASEDTVVVVLVALAGGTADVAVREGRRTRAKARSIAEDDDDDGCRRARRGAASLGATARACWRPAASGVETRISIGFGELFFNLFSDERNETRKNRR